MTVAKKDKKTLSKKDSNTSLLNDVRRELKAESDDGIRDDEYDGSRDPNNLGSLFNLAEGRKPRHPDEVAIDEMLIGMEGNDWYLKLSKETSPNVWQFKRRIDQFRHWADMEYQINLLVQSETKAEVKRRGKVISWGSGRYMVTFFSDNGLRGNKKKPVFFDIDAQEPDALPPTSQQNEALDILRETITSPKDVIQQNVESMQRGMELAAMASGGNNKSSDNMFALMMNQSNNQTQMMVGLLTALIPAMSGNKNSGPDPLDFMRGMVGTMKDVGAFPSQSNQTTSLTDQVTLFKTLGLIRDPGENDPINAITKMKGILGIVQELTGAGPTERPGIVEKLIDAFGPHAGKLLTTIENVSTIKAAEAVRLSQQPQDGRPIVLQVPARGQVTQQSQAQIRQVIKPESKNGFPNIFESNEDGGYGSGPVNMPDLPPEAYAAAAADKIANEQINEYQPQQEDNPVAVDTKTLIKEFAVAVNTKDYTKFEKITTMLDQFFGEGVIRQRLLTGQMTAKDLINNIMMFDKNNYATQPTYLSLQDYVFKYVESIAKNKDSNMLIATCTACGAKHEFDNEAQWNDEFGESNGNIICNINGCQGILKK